MIAIMQSQGIIGVSDDITHEVRIVKVNLADAVKAGAQLPRKQDLYVAKEMQITRGIKPVADIEFRPLNEQPWTQYLGKRGDCIYRRGT